MRGAFGLVSLLVCTAIIIYAWANYTAPVAKRGTELKTQAEQIAGRDENGKPVSELITTAGEPGTGHLKDLLVVDVAADSPWQTYYGLQKDDKITMLNGLGVDTYDDAGLAKDMMTTAYQGKQPITVMRGGKQITLPAPAGAPLVTQTPSPATTPAPAAPPPPRQNIRDQFNQLKIPQPE